MRQLLYRELSVTDGKLGAAIAIHVQETRNLPSRAKPAVALWRESGEN
jgi:hypothetical protein